MNRSLRDSFARLVAEEQKFLRREFLAPVVEQGTIWVRLSGIVYSLILRDRFRGWGIFLATSTKEARLVRTATLAERSDYLNVLMRRKMILVQPSGDDWLAWPASEGDTRFGSAKLVMVRLVEDAQRFDLIDTRWDGRNAFFEQIDERIDPARIDYLREQFEAKTPVNQLQFRGLTREERTAYGAASEIRRKLSGVTTEDRIRESLEQAGAVFRSLLERGDGLRVEFEVDGQRHISVVNKDDFSLQLAGICLDGADRHFDLTSLVGVIREAEGALRIGADNHGMDAEDYWEIHPPR